MRMRKMLVGALMATSLLGAAVVAADDEVQPRSRQAKFVHKMGPSVEHAAMQNIMAEALSAKTGRSAAEIKAMFEDAPPPEVARELGLKGSDMKVLFKQARGTLIQRASAAGLISAEQAEVLRSAEVHDRMRHGPPRELPSLDDDEG